MRLKKCAAALAALGLFITGLAGCADQSFSSVLTVDGVPVGPGLYRLFQIRAYSEAAQSVADSDRLFSQTIAGKPAEEWINERTLSLLRGYFYYETEFKSRGLSFTEAETAESEAALAAGWPELSPICERNGISQSDFSLYDQNLRKGQRVFADRYAEVTDEALGTFLDENFARMNYVQLPLVTGAGAPLAEEDAAAVDSAAQKALTRLKKGADFTKTANELASDCYARAGFSAGTRSSYVQTSYINLSSVPASAASLASTVAQTPEGECGIFLAEGYYCVLFRRQPNYTTAQELAALRPSVLYQMKGAEFSAAMQTACERYNVIVNDAAASFYSPRTLDLSSGTLAETAALQPAA